MTDSVAALGNDKRRIVDQVAPSTADNLDGITRQSLITLAREDLGIPFVERPIGRTKLYVADEVFLCGTGAEVTAARTSNRWFAVASLRDPFASLARSNQDLPVYY